MIWYDTVRTDHRGLFVGQTLHTLFRFPGEFDEGFSPILGDEFVGVDAESVHVTVIRRDADVVHQKGEHVDGLGVMGEEIHDAPTLLE